MTGRTVFSAVMAWLEAATGLPITPGDQQAKLARMQAYYELLGDLPLAVLKAACRRVALEPTFGRFPEVGAIRAAAASVMSGPAMTFAEAWPLVVQASNLLRTHDANPVCRLAPGGRLVSISTREHNDGVYANLPPIVAKAMRVFSPGSLWEDPTCRAQFRRVFEEVVAREREELLLPPALTKAITAIGHEHAALPAPVDSPVRAIVAGLADKFAVKD